MKPTSRRPSRLQGGQRSAQASAHPLSQAQVRLFCLLTVFLAGVLSEVHDLQTFATCIKSIFYI